MNAADIQRIDAQAREQFHYVSDGVIDTWRSHADQVLEGVAWQGDCDDLASTVLDLMGRRGMPLDHRFRLLCSTSGALPMNHMVAAAQDDDGRFWIVGDTFSPSYPAEMFEFFAIDYNRLDEEAAGQPVWRKGLPWAVG